MLRQDVRLAVDRIATLMQITNRPRGVLMSAMEKARNVSTAIGLLIIAAAFVMACVMGTIDYFGREARKQEVADRVAEIARIEASVDAPGLKSKRILDIAYSNLDVTTAVDARYPDHSTLLRIWQHVKNGYQQTNPLTPAQYEKAAQSTCYLWVNRVSRSSRTFESDNAEAYNNARAGLETWRPYLTDYDKVWASCAYHFQYMQAEYEKKQKEKDGLTMRDIGASVGQATNQVGKWWDDATKPVSDAVDEFKAGFQSGKN